MIERDNYILKSYWRVRREFLKWIVPEWVWPKTAFLDGVPIGIRNAPYSFATKRILVKGEYEQNERILLKDNIVPGDVIIEMGGSIGILTAIISHWTGNNGKVISVEASQNIGNYSRTWLEQRGNIQVIIGFGFPVFALQKPLKVIGLDESAGSLGGIVSYSLGIEKMDSSSNQVYDLKKLMVEFNIEPSLLVIDIEGSEKIMIENSLEFPQTVRLVLIELHPHLYGVDVRDEIIEKITQEGFKIKDKKGDVILFERHKT